MTAHSPLTFVDSRLSETGGKALAFEGPASPVKIRLLEALVAWFATQGLRVSVVRVGPELEGGDTGKDTWKFRQAGATPVVLAAPGLCQITYVIPGNQDFALVQALDALTPGADLILVDIPAGELLPKVIMLEEGAAPQFSDNTDTLALVSPEPAKATAPVFQPHQVSELGRHILNTLKKNNESKMLANPFQGGGSTR